MKKYLIITCLVFSVQARAEIPEEFSKAPSFSDEFSGESLDLTKWNYRGLGQRNGCFNVKDTVAVEDNKLVITSYSSNREGPLRNYCGMISTDGLFKQKYGYWEAKLRFNYTPGIQSAFWLQSPTIGQDTRNAQKSGVEIDVFEHVAGAKSGEFDHAMHWNGYGSAHRQWVKNLTNTNINDGNFHKIAVAWTPEGYTFYVDDIKSIHVAPKTAPVSAAEEYIILSTEVPPGASVNGLGGLHESKSRMEVEYVKVYPYIGK